MGILTSTLSSDLKNSHPRTFFPLLLEREEGKKKRETLMEERSIDWLPSHTRMD